jgi:hypothetical protein
MENTNMIYGLRDPRNDVYRYIGKTTIGKGRPLSHLVRSHNKDVNMWVSELHSLGTEPYVDIIESNIELDDLSKMERYYITYYSDLFGGLLNYGTNSFDSLTEPNKLSIEEIKSTHKALVNIGDVYKLFKISTGFNDDIISSALGISRPTLYKLKKYSPNTNIESYTKMIFFASIGIEGVFKYYYSVSNEFKGAHPDTIEEFIKKCLSDYRFCGEWFTKCFVNLFVKNT